jgi:hypothetical protein
MGSCCGNEDGAGARLEMIRKGGGWNEEEKLHGF